jgi:hypothetical protein
VLDRHADTHADTRQIKAVERKSVEIEETL